MNKKIIIICACIFLLPGYTANAASPEIIFSKEDRVLVVAAHPDDETLGAGGAIQRALGAGAQVKILYLTHGDQNELASLFYQKKPLLRKEDFLKSGRIRKEEAVRAMKILGLDEKNLIFLGYPDFGTLGIWKKHWGSAKPYRSILTRMNKVLYKEDLSYGNFYKGENIAGDFGKVLENFKPTKIFVTAPYDLNSDHQAAFLFLQTALLDLHSEAPAAQVYAYIVHYRKWPKPRSLQTNMFLDIPQDMDSNQTSNWTRFNLTQDEIDKKKAAVFEYKSQMAYSKNFLSSFVRKNELFYPVLPTKVATEAKMPEEGYFESGESFAGDILYTIFQGELWVDVRLTDPWDHMGVLNINIFSYSAQVIFSKMPKVSLRLFGNKLKVNKGCYSSANSGILYSVGMNRILIRIPLKYLDKPDHIFVSALTAREELSLSFGSWQLLQLN